MNSLILIANTVFTLLTFMSCNSLSVSSTCDSSSWQILMTFSPFLVLTTISHLSTSCSTLQRACRGRWRFFLNVMYIYIWYNFNICIVCMCVCEILYAGYNYIFWSSLALQLNSSCSASSIAQVQLLMPVTGQCEVFDHFLVSFLCLSCTSPELLHEWEEFRMSGQIETISNL